MSTDDGRKNRECWNATSPEYQRKHGPQLDTKPLAWGIWALPEAELQVLGDLSGQDVLELGCGGAQWTGFLAQRGARVVGLDQSSAQLTRGRAFLAELGVEAPLVLADGEELPFGDGCFDVVFCDHGVISFADPAQVVPEVARVLRPGGLFAFNRISTLSIVCWSDEKDEAVPALQQDWFGLGRLDDGEHVSHHLPTGEWIRLFRRNGFAVEDLLELRPPENAETTYDQAIGYEWARRWPGEELWRLRRDG